MNSRWSRVLGLPVAGLAAFAYAGLLLASFFLQNADSRIRRAAWVLTVALAAAVVAAGGWFTYIQASKVGEWCPWCLGVHAAGGTLLILLVLWMVKHRHAAGRPGWVGVAGGSVAGVVATAALAAAQLLVVPAPVPPRVVALKLGDGPRQLVLDDVPAIGSPRAKHVIAVIADYTCPHCRALHQQVSALLAKHPRDLAVVVVAVPMTSRCNRYFQKPPHPMHREACELARLSLAVFRAKREAFAAYDHWLFDGTSAPSAESARRKAAELVGHDALARAETDPWIEEQLNRNISLYGSAYGGDRPGKIPVLILPDQVVLNVPDDPKWLESFVAEKLGLK